MIISYSSSSQTSFESLRRLSPPNGFRGATPGESFETSSQKSDISQFNGKDAFSRSVTPNQTSTNESQHLEEIPNPLSALLPQTEEIPSRDSSLLGSRGSIPESLSDDLPSLERIKTSVDQRKGSFRTPSQKSDVCKLSDKDGFSRSVTSNHPSAIESEHLEEIPNPLSRNLRQTKQTQRRQASPSNLECPCSIS